MSPCPYGYWSLYFVHAEAVFKCKTANSFTGFYRERCTELTSLEALPLSKSQLSFTAQSVISAQLIH